MAEHGDLQPDDHQPTDPEGRGNHGIEGYTAVADEAARLALGQVAPTGGSIGDRTRVVWQLAGTPSAPVGAYIADGAGGWVFLGDVAASETASGVAELATQAETDAGTDDLRIVTPLKLATAPVQSHGLGGASHAADTLANLNSKVSDATLDDSADPRDPNAHTLGGAAHSVDTLANLNAKVSDATLDDSSAARPPTAHALGGAAHSADTLANLNTKVSDATLDGTTDTRTPVAATESIVGGAELATQAEADAGTDDVRIITALKLANFTGLGKFPLPFASAGTAMVANKILPVTASPTAVTFPNAPAEGTICGMLNLALGANGDGLSVDASAEPALVVDPKGQGSAPFNSVQTYPAAAGLLTLWQYTALAGTPSPIWVIIGHSPVQELIPVALAASPVAAVILIGRTNIIDPATHTSVVFPATSGVSPGGRLAYKSDPGSAGAVLTLNGNGSNVESPVDGGISTSESTNGTIGEHLVFEWNNSEWMLV